MYNNDINDIIENYNSECIEFIREHEESALEPLILNGAWPSQVPKSFLIDQIKSRKKLRTKVPEWANNYAIIVPPEQNLQQSSSQWTAMFKADLSSCSVVLDATGGMGVDSYFFSKAEKRVYYLDKNPMMCAIAGYNFKQLGAEIEVINASIEDFLANNSGEFSEVHDALMYEPLLVYVDPSRKVENEKVYNLWDAEPRVYDIWDHLKLLSDQVLIKASPMANIEESCIHNDRAAKIHALSVNNDLKELLYLYTFHYEEGQKQRLIAVNIQKNDNQIFFQSSIEYDEENGLKVDNSLLQPIPNPSIEAIEVGKLPKEEDEFKSGYLYDPWVVLKKLDLMKEVAKEYSLVSLHPSTHIFYANEHIWDFPGRVFTIVDGFPPNNKVVKKWLIRERIQHINIWAHNYPESTTRLKKRFRIGDGGTRFMIFTKIQGNRHWLWIADLESKEYTKL
ncbi:MAG: class I SAM-dependent methyltransferase [Bacteroidetes bacterium]|nr:class I SAM-dependent methyltransferase [Bacteroidota bacterium]